MQQHYQVINLHNIIRNQEAKIHELKQQLRIAEQRYENRYGQIIQNNRITLDEKLNTIQFLKGQLEKSQINRTSFVTDAHDKFDREKQKYEKQLIIYKKKCLDLQQKVKRVSHESILQIEQLKQQNLKLNQQIRRFNEIKTSVSIQISKLNHFYKNSIFQIGKRKQTLLWVQKFTQYLQKSDKKQQRILQDINNFVKNQINGLRTNLGQMVTQIAKSQHDLNNNKYQIEKSIGQLIKQLKQQCSQILQQNENFWNNIIKQQKQLQKNEQIKILQSQIANLNEKYSQQTEELKNLIKVYETQKKTLILGFQQLRSLNQHRQANYRDQIKQLKKNIVQLIQTGSERDKQFQEQIKTMTNQIQGISQRYYQNIQFPVRKINEKINQEVQQVKLQLSRIHGDISLKNSIQNLQKILQAYIEKNSRQKNLKQFVFNVSQLSKINQVIQSSLQQKSFYVSKVLASKQNTYFQRSSQQIMQQSQQQKQVDLREKLNKNHYQLILAKKHLAKLKEHCQNLQKKIGPPPALKKSQKQNLLKKFAELETENQALKEHIAYIDEVHKQEIQEMKKKGNNIHTYEFLKELFQKINYFKHGIQNYINEQKQQFHELRQNFKILKSVLHKPMQSFQMLVKQMSQFNLISTSQPAYTDRSMNAQRNMKSCIAFGDETKTYKQIISKRNENYHNTNKLLTDFIKTIRQANPKQLKQKIMMNGKKEEQVHVKKSDLKFRGIEKKMKQMQNQKVKQKQEMIAKIQKLQSSFDKIVQKINKSNNLKTALTKFQTNLDYKIDQIVTKAQLKLDKTEIGGIKEEVITDLRTKLQQANCENQGLRKQMLLLYNDKKN